MKIIWSPLAIERTSEIASYIAKDNISAAEKWLKIIFKKVKQLEEFPTSYRKIPELERNDIRELIYGNYRISYRIESNQISILTIRHRKQILPIEEIQ